MYEFIKDIATNLFFILFLVLLYQYWSEKKDWSRLAKQIAVFLFGAFGIVLCLEFAIPTGEGLVFDLRYIPYIIGGLYGGPYVTIGLYFIILLYRFSIGGMVGFFFNSNYNDNISRLYGIDPK